MKHQKKILLLILVSFWLLILNACSSAGAYQQSVYDDDQKISAQGDSYTFVNRIGESDETEISLTFSGFSGKQTLWEVDADEDGTISMAADITIKGGRFKLCLIDSDNHVTAIANDSTSGELSVPVVKGVSRIALVGDGAKGEIKISLSENEGITIQAVGE